MSKKLWYGLAAVATNVTKPDTQEFVRTSTVTEKRYSLLALNPSTYRVTLQPEGGNEVHVRPDRKITCYSRLSLNLSHSLMSPPMKADA